MFQFPGLPPPGLCVRPGGDAPRRRAGFSHSETRGSKGVCPSPRIIAACRVLRRLPVPRHPPPALTIFLLSQTVWLNDSLGPFRGALGVILHEMRSSRRKSSLVTLCSSQGTARASPGDRTPRGPGPRAARGRQGTRGMAPRPDGTARRHNRFSRRDLSLPRKEVIQPHLPVRLPCYDFTPLTLHTFGASPLSVGPATSGADDSGGVTGGVYKARERIHRGVLIRDY